ncbi:uncharacterized protein LY89DRAFT_713478 [Mollisia scopiformis]|uniref:Uncharacterized protein n=1 Tax=Mollisia scopiformis TaxID=149040 RepID=A0A194XWZ4_MOLSC|nr:uncharacterized protein LY89DRAFT_713478 [Mollisia scopiformis]KUJ24686.1 hypothetical protein LY89DRAFT_713478 [Mollisia scopiformis]
MADANFSTLEAVNPGYEPFRQGKPLPTDSGKQVVTEEAGKYVVPVVPYSDGIETTPVQKYPTEVQYHEPPIYDKQPNGRNRKWLWIGGAICLIVVLAAVLGGVLGSRKSSKSSTSTPSSTPSSNATLQHQIAAVAFPSNDINNTRVYYQANDGTLVEAANSASNTTWGFTSIGHPEKLDSSLAAAVSRPGFPLEISVYYTDNNYLLQDIIYNSTTNEWNSGTISGSNYITHPNSSLSATYNQCRRCANTTIVAYQDINGFVQVANLTSSGWTLTQLKFDAYTGTGLALQPFYRAGSQDQINLYHQTSDLNITLGSWDPTLSNTGVDGWSDTEQVYNVGVAGTPLAAASSYTNVTSGFESWIQMLQLSTTGIEVNTWSGNINDWLDQYNHPSPMANSSVNVKEYDSIAVTAIGSAFAVVKSSGNDSIQSWQVSDDLLDWTSTGTVAVWA